MWHAAAPTWDPTRLVFLDETGITNNLLRRYGRALRGARVHDHAPCARWQTSTFLAALRVTGLTAPGVFDGALDGASFLAYIEQILVPTLHPGDIVIADNLSAHKVAGVRQAIERVGATLCYLPPYSPDLNPLNSASRSSKPSCAPPAVDPPKPSGLSSAPVCRTSAPRNAAITFDTAAIRAPHGHEKRFSSPRSFSPPPECEQCVNNSSSMRWAAAAYPTAVSSRILGVRKNQGRCRRLTVFRAIQESRQDFVLPSGLRCLCDGNSGDDPLYRSSSFSTGSVPPDSSLACR